MLKCQKNKLWLENIGNLICTFSLVPLDGMSLAEQMNALTRLVIVIFLVLLLLGFRHSLLFLLLALLFIIILYYIQRKNMATFRTENYTQPSMLSIQTNPKTGNQHVEFDNTTAGRFCNDERPLDGPGGAFNNPNWMSTNQKLVGPANPKTKIPPVVVAPSADLSYWKANNLVTHSAINEESQIDVYQSGYQVSTCCAPTYDCTESLEYNDSVTEKFCGPRQCYSDRRPRDHSQPGPRTGPRSGPTPRPYWPPGPPAGAGGTDQGVLEKVGYSYNQSPVVENFDFPYLKTSPEKGMLIRSNLPGDVNIACGYNPKQLQQAGLPTNLPAGNCEQDPAMKQYNENLFTQTIQPGVYTRNEINEPINANIGISFTQQHPSVTCKTDFLTGEVEYTEHDPRIIEPVVVQPNMGVQTPITEANIYDPRFTGYGTSYRSYTDDNVGQTRFYYDDVNAIRMPNYVVRSNIDHQPFADSYGPIPTGDSQGNKFNPNIRALANDAFMTAAIQHRTDISQLAMRKANNRQWQRRQAPIRTAPNRMNGGMSSCK